jgi:hypothetical protein
MTHVPARGLSVALVVGIVLWQATSCCCCLGGAVTPSMTPQPSSKDMARAFSDRINETTAQQDAFTVEITDRELTSYVIALLQSGAGEFPARDMQIQFSDGYAEIWATFIEIAPSEVPAYLRVEIDAVDGDLVFSITHANAGTFPIPGALRETISQILSESLAELDLGLEIERVEVRPGKTVITGRVVGDVPALPSTW